jgi:Phage capsid family
MILRLFSSLRIPGRRPRLRVWSLPGSRSPVLLALVADLYTTETALPARFRKQAVWMGNRAQYQKIRQFALPESSSPVFEHVASGATEVIGYPAYENSAMASGTGSGAKVMALGDPSYYCIVDRVGMDIEITVDRRCGDVHADDLDVETRPQHYGLRGMKRHASVAPLSDQWQHTHTKDAVDFQVPHWSARTGPNNAYDQPSAGVVRQGGIGSTLQASAPTQHVPSGLTHQDQHGPQA